jgi:hypothetical protein
MSKNVEFQLNFELANSHRNLRTKQNMYLFWHWSCKNILGKEHLARKPADLHPGQGNLLQRSNF